MDHLGQEKPAGTQSQEASDPVHAVLTFGLIGRKGNEQEGALPLRSSTPKLLASRSEVLMTADTPPNQIAEAF